MGLPAVDVSATAVRRRSFGPVARSAEGPAEVVVDDGVLGGVVGRGEEVLNRA